MKTCEMAKKRTTVAIDEELLKWIEEQIKRKRFASVSHAVEYAIYKLIESEKSQD